MKVINLFSGPGCGKSTTAAGYFYHLKSKGINCELVQEYAKDKVWEGNTRALQCQPYVTAKQLYRQFRLDGEVDFLITDSPLILGTFYPGFGSSPTFDAVILEWFNLFDNINILLKRDTESHKYNPKGRYQTEDKAVEIDLKIERYLKEANIPFHVLKFNSDFNIATKMLDGILGEI